MVGSEHYVAESSLLSSDAEQQGQGQGQGPRSGKGRQGKPRRSGAAGAAGAADQLDAAALGIRYLRGGEVVEVLDETQAVVGERDENGRERQPVGNVRTFRLALDAAQYQLDQECMLAAQGDDAEDVYATFNLLVRRKAKENNFKAVLETIRDLMNTEYVICVSISLS
jgi:intron-binding protein aquarius